MKRVLSLCLLAFALNVLGAGVTFAQSGQASENARGACPAGSVLQDSFLDALINEYVPVSIYLVNGIKLQGQITRYDSQVIFLRNSVEEVIYKHAIATIVPARPI